METNPGKCKLLFNGNKYEVMASNIADLQVIETHRAKLLGILIDSDLNFDGHVKSIC